MKTLEERKSILENEITKQLKNGWRISSRTETGCQLIKDKKRNGCLLVILFLFFIIPGIFYLILTQGRTMSVFIEVNDEGKIKYTSKDLSRAQVEQINSLVNK